MRKSDILYIGKMRVYKFLEWTGYLKNFHYGNFSDRKQSFSDRAGILMPMAGIAHTRDHFMKYRNQFYYKFIFPLY